MSLFMNRTGEVNRQKRKQDEAEEPPVQPPSACREQAPSNGILKDTADSDTFKDGHALFNALCSTVKCQENVIFNGNYTIAKDPLVGSKERVKMMAHEVWKVTGYRFINSVKDHPPINEGHKTRFWCCQDEAKKKKARPSCKPDVKHRDHVGMESVRNGGPYRPIRLVQE
ncbi:hypothetical protein DFH94DRAFT_686704 [Russula ochroleuca]|uniref:Uncharacterized protein n=1 Tax=Russula ochroleuca TaxID=152965 RepID=A0A9P5JV76_9AGAM|nr:hypothetical protein DFH94DRAFT_686704 [Russula ochroleuca]